MQYNFQYQSGARVFDPSFGRVIVADDGGYDRGYADGLKQGYDDGYAAGNSDGLAEGYNKGHAEGTEEGYSIGYSEGYDVGYAAGYAEGKAAGYTEGQAEGYNRGYSLGYGEGETTGYTKGQADGYETGHDAGYTEGEQTAQAAAEAANAVILEDCNTILPTKGASTAETLEQVPQRIWEIENEGAGAWKYVCALNNTFQKVAFPENTELVLPVQKLYTMTNAIYQATGLTKLTLKGQTDGAVGGTYLFMNTTIQEIDFSELNGGVFTFASGVKYAFQDCSRLKYIRGELNMENVKSTTGTLNMFRSCGQIVEVRFTKGSIFVDIAITSANLSADSTQSIVDGFADMTGQTAITLTVYKTVGEKMTPTQKATLTAKNVTLVY